MKGNKKVKFLVLSVSLLFNLYILYIIYSTIQLIVVTFNFRVAVVTIIVEWLYKVFEWPVVIAIIVSGYLIVLKHLQDKEGDRVSRISTVVFFSGLFFLLPVYLVWTISAETLQEFFQETISYNEAMAILIFAVVLIVSCTICGCVYGSVVASVNMYDVCKNLKHIRPRAYAEEDEEELDLEEDSLISIKNVDDSKFDKIDLNVDT